MRVVDQVARCLQFALKHPIMDYLIDGRRGMPAELSTPTQQNSWEELLEQYLTCERLRRGEFVSGTVVRVSNNDVVVDVGAKCAGIVPADGLQKVSPEVLADIKVGTDVGIRRRARGWRRKLDTFAGASTISEGLADRTADDGDSGDH